MNGTSFFLVSKRLSQTNWKPVYRSQMEGDLNNTFEWRPFNLLLSDLTTDNNYDEIFKIEFYE